VTKSRKAGTKVNKDFGCWLLVSGFWFKLNTKRKWSEEKKAPSNKQPATSN
jgi:hypothetical protein